MTRTSQYDIAKLCRRDGIAQSWYYSWSKELLKAGKHNWLVLQTDLSRY